MLLVLLMSMMLVLPPGMDLELCFGTDGHIDFSLNGCQNGVSPQIPDRERSSIYDTAHHGECLDVAMACSTVQEFVRTDGKTDSYESELKIDSSKTALLFSKLRTDSAGAYLDSNVYSIPFKNFPSPQLVSLRTVVLLI